MFARVRSTGKGQKRTLYAPAVRARKGTYLDLFTNATRAGITSARVDGAIVSIEPPPKLTKAKEHTIDLIVYYGPLADLDRAVFDRALAWGGGTLRVGPGMPTAHFADGEEILSTSRACSEVRHRHSRARSALVLVQHEAGPVRGVRGHGRPRRLRRHGGPRPARKAFECRVCKGDRLAPIPRSVRLGGETYPRIMEKSVTKALAKVRALALTGNDATIAKAPLAELKRRLEFVEQVGLGYLGLGRSAGSLSGGEMQRLRLSAQLGSGLTGALYVLDEPTIGLHPRDTGRLIANLRALVDTGSTVVVVEHDAETIQAADHLTDLGPGGGRNGGHIIAEGTPAAVLACAESPTGSRAPRAAGRRAPEAADGRCVARARRSARATTCKDVTFRVPAGRMCVVAGVSGSGKSTLVQKVFFPALRKQLKLVADTPGRARLDPRAEERSSARSPSINLRSGARRARFPPRSSACGTRSASCSPALPEAKARGWTPARFSFNTPTGGRCTACQGQGSIVAEMSFLPEVVTPCETCQGARFEPSTLDVKWGGLSIGDVLRLSAEEAATVFAAFRKIAGPLKTITELGCGYLSIGQGSNTLSGGEAQRLKLAGELTAGMAHEPTVYVLDEPTTGLHLSDVGRLVKVLDRLVERGDTLVIVEHHPDVIANADWVVELGPEAGDAGGTIVFEGEPRLLVKKKTATGRALGAIAAAMSAV